MLLTLQKGFLEMRNDVKIYYADLPCSVRGFVKVFPDDFYGIVLNSRLSWEQNQKTLQHELDHISAHHLYTEVDIQEIEYLTHAV